MTPNCPAPPADPRDAELARLRDQVAELTHSHRALARRNRRLQRVVADLTLQLEIVL